MRRSVGVALVLVLAFSVSALAGPRRVVSSSRVKPNIKLGKRLTVIDPFKNLANWAKKPNDSHAYHIDFTATSMDRYGRSTFFEGRMSCPSTNKGIVHTKASALRYFSDRRYKHPTDSGMVQANRPFDALRTDKVYVKLNFGAKQVTIVKGSQVTKIPLKVHHGVFHGHATSGPKRARYSFSFRKGKQYIVQ
mgnify:CR=1 FL=1